MALAVSGHGFGHAVRCAEVASALLRRGARVVVRTDAPTWLFPPGVEHLPSPGWPLDVGVAQHGGLDLDVDETRRRWQTFAHAFEARAAIEADLLRAHGATILLGDIPALAFAAAARADVPCLALGNFGWDWIYAAWPNFEQPIELIQASYAAAEGILRLPMHSTAADAFPAFQTTLDVPLIARRATRSRLDTRRELGVRPDARLVLLSFGGFAAKGLDVAALGACRGYVFVLTPPLSDLLGGPVSNVVALRATPADYVSLVAAADVVVTKPGYGIVADALANQVAVLYTDRGPFREYDVLVDALTVNGHARFIRREDLLAGRIGADLDMLFNDTSAWAAQPTHGADVVADRVLCRIAAQT